MSYVIGTNRVVTVDRINGEYYVRIQDLETPLKRALFPGCRWAQFISLLPQFDDAIKKLLRKQSVCYSVHLGGHWYGIVRSHRLCVDLRKFYFDKTHNRVRHTNIGIRLRITEYLKLKRLLHQIHQEYPALHNLKPCFLSHENQISFYSCMECRPFDYFDYYL